MTRHRSRPQHSAADNGKPNAPASELDAMAARLDALEARVAALERERAALRHRPESPSPVSPADVPLPADDDPFWVVGEDAPLLTPARRRACAGAWAIDLADQRWFWSASYYDLFGLPRSIKPSHEHWIASIHPDDRARVEAEYRHALAADGLQHIEFRILRNGEVRWLHSEGRVLLDAGRPVRVTGIVWDVTERKQAEDAARAAERLAQQRLTELENLYRNAPVGLCLLDRDLRYLRINERLAEINGFPAAAHLGKTLRELLPTVADATEPLLREVIATGRPLYNQEALGETPSRPGVERSWQTHALPVRDVEGDITGISIVVEETTERRQAELALRESARRKDDFLAALAHELRNPLAPLGTGLDIMAEQGRGLPWAEQTVEKMQRQLSQLVRLVDDLLDVSRIDRGRIELRREQVAIAEVLEQAVDTSRPLLDARRHRLTLELPPAPLLVDADPVRLGQVFTNLLTNAAHYTKPDGVLVVRINAVAGECVVRIEDNGVGIAPELLPRIFERFVSDHSQTDARGLGIGLHLVRCLVHLHGGQVEAHSDGPGRGSTFVVRLPCLVDAEVCEQRHVPPAPVPASGGGRRVLIVDDNRDAADCLDLMLRFRGHNTRVVYDGFSALRVGADFRPDVALIDIGMPEIDGCETAERLRATDWGRHVLLIAVTGWSQDEVRARTRAAGFHHHLVKPVAAAVLGELLAAPATVP